MFADDTNIFYSNKCLDLLLDKLNIELQKISSWFKCNKLSLNINKTNYIYFKSTKTPTILNKDIKIDGVSLEQKTCTKFLGVTLDETLSWNQHLNSVTTSVARGVGILFKLKNIVPDNILVLLYNTLILPYISYCNIVWANCGLTKTNPILLLQKKALRVCTGSTYRAHADPLFYQLKTLKVHDINTLQTANLMVKITSQLALPYFRDLITRNRNIHTYPTRNSANYHLNNPRLLSAHKSIRHYGPDIWNPLPDAIKLCATPYSFKTAMKKYILAQYNCT